jgi:hypothetical protein
MSTILSNLGQASLVTGSVTVSAGTDAALTSNDGSASLTRNAAGNYTVTFGHAFLSAPVVTANALLTVGTATEYATDAIGVVIDAVATNSLEFNVIDVTDATTNGLLVDTGTVHFMAFGLRDN